MTPEQAAALRVPFAPEQIGKLPKAGTVLDFVGHAQVTARLLDVDPHWVWEPVAFAEDGGPMIRHGAKEASLWIRLTVCGVTRLGVGTAPAGAFELEKQLISDALRNASMRFGVALDLWSREPLTAEVPAFDPQVDADPAVIETLKARIAGVNEDVRLAFTLWKHDQAFPWPWPVRACEAMHAELDRLQVSAGSTEDGDLPVDSADDPETEPF